MRIHLQKYGVTVELQKGLVTFEQGGEKVAATLATFRNGQPTELHEKVVCQYLIGADGAKGRSDPFRTFLHNLAQRRAHKEAAGFDLCW